VQQQQQELLRQVQQQGGQHSSPNGPHASLSNGNGSTPFNMANANGAPSPHGNASSPRSQNSTSGQLSSGHVPVLVQIANKIKQQYPNMNDEEVQKHASQQIQMWQQQASQGGPKRPQATNQAALNAAVGAMNSAAHANNNVNAVSGGNAGFPQGMSMTPEQLQQLQQAQRMRMMQASQPGAAGRQAQQSAAMHGMNAMGMGGMPMPNGGQGQVSTNSPVMNMARPVSQSGQGQVSRSATPSARSGSMSGPGPQGALSPGGGQARPGSSRAMVGTPQSQSAQPAAAPTPQPNGQSAS